jgi:ribosomal protein L40E
LSYKRVVRWQQVGEIFHAPDVRILAAAEHLIQAHAKQRLAPAGAGTSPHPGPKTSKNACISDAASAPIRASKCREVSCSGSEEIKPDETQLPSKIGKAESRISRKVLKPCP